MSSAGAGPGTEQRGVLKRARRLVTALGHAEGRLWVLDRVRAHLHLPAPKRAATAVFSDWAARDRDVRMQSYHEAAVSEMLAAAFGVLDTSRGFTSISAGCGNGWVVRRLCATPGCLAATGVDGSTGMIAKARAIDPQGDYVCADLATWNPSQPVDLVISMEVIYYLHDPVSLLRRIANVWLKPGGCAVFGIDHY